MYGHLLVRYFI